MRGLNDLTGSSLFNVRCVSNAELHCRRRTLPLPLFRPTQNVSKGPVFARLRSIRCRLLCCGGRPGAAATDGAARGCGAVPIPHTGEENTPKPRGGGPKMICLELVFKKKIVGAVSFCCGVSVLLRERLIVSQAG